MNKGTTYHLTGNTYAHRTWLKQRGAQWNPIAQRWELSTQGNGVTRFLYDLRKRRIRYATV